MPLERDPFWDRGMLAGASALDPSAYHDPSEEALQASHTTMAAALPPPIMGARGTIVRGSTLGGAPIGWDPHGVATRVNIDPDSKQGFVVDMTRITEAMSAAAVDNAGIKNAQTVEDLRFRASTAMQQFAINEEIDSPRTTAGQRVAPINMPGVYVVPESTLGGAQLQPQPYTPVTAQGIQTRHAEIPMAKHNIPGFAPDNVAVPQMAPPAPVYQPIEQAPQQTATKQASLFAGLQKAEIAAKRVLAPTSTAATGAPTYKITLEIKDYPTSIEAWYHDVVRNEQVLALVYDTRAIGYPRTRLRPQPEDIALHVEGSQIFYICTDPGISFTYEGQEFSVFLIKGEHPYQEPDVSQTGLMM